MRVAAVLMGGICYALALPPFDLAAFGWLTLVPLLLAIRGESTGSAFCYGALLGYTSGWAVTWCFADAAARYFQLSLPLAVVGLSLWYLVVCGVPFGLFAAASALILRSYRFRSAGVLIPALWVATEVLRGRWMGQPWGLLGYTQHGHLGLIQLAALTGVYGVSFLLALGSVALAEAIVRLCRGRGRALHSILAPAAVITACWAGGALFVHTSPAGGFGEHEVAIVQTNLAPAFHWTRSYTDAQVSAHLRATDGLSSTAHPALIVWPENSVPRYLETEPGLAAQLAGVAVRHRADLLFGGPRSDGRRIFNTARLITASGENGGYYDKQRLLLFAEEKRLILSSTPTPNESPKEFTPGTRSGVLHSFVALGVSICHEIVHGDLIAQTVRDGAELLVNIANDGWLDAGHEFAGRQHLAMAVFRAVETRRYLVRAATTGNSAVVDPYGRLVGSLPPGTTGVLITKVGGRSTLTPYVRLGDLFAFVCVGVAVTALLRLREG